MRWCSYKHLLQDVKRRLLKQALKQTVYEQQRVRPCHQHFAFAGTQLEDDRTLAGYNVQEGSTNDLLPRVFDGACSIKMPAQASL